MTSDSVAAPSLDPSGISRKRKLLHLKELSEDEFRDRVVIPLFERHDFTAVEDLCGPNEEGKDCVFVQENSLGQTELYAVQTKRGDLSLARESNKNVETAVTQLRTAIATDILLTSPRREKRRPNKVVLCISGEISHNAKRHIIDKVDDPNLEIYDANWVIAELDDHYKEFWYGIDANIFPYLRSLQKHVLQASDGIALGQGGLDQSGDCPISDAEFVNLYFTRIVSEVKKISGQPHRVPKIEQYALNGVLSLKDPLLLITGEGGSGKTTTLRRIVFQLSEKAFTTNEPPTLPVMLRASDVAGTSAPLVDIAAQVAAGFTPSEKVPFSSSDLEAGRLLILVDGLDELASNDARENVLRSAINFASEFRKCKVIVTSRNYGFITKLELLREFTRLQIDSIDIRQAAKLIDLVSKRKQIPTELARETLRQLQDVHGINLTPLLVTVFLVASDFSQKDIPPNIAAIFKNYTDLMLGRWDERKGLQQQYQKNVKDHLLCRLGFILHRDRRRVASLSECRSVFSAELSRIGLAGDLDVLFDEIVYRSGLLRVVDDEVEFKHQVLQEFFAGRGVDDTEFLKEVLSDYWWRKPILFYFGDKPQRLQEVHELIASAKQRAPADMFEAAISLGLAAQACYLSDRSSKIDAIEWVVKALAANLDDAVKVVTKLNGGFALSAFITEYLNGRDAVACDLITEVTKRVANSESLFSNDNAVNATALFWCIVGLIESRNLKLAEELVRKFKPSEARLLLGIHLGAIFVEKMRISTAQDAAAAKQICARTGPFVFSLRDEVLAEMKGMLLEVRKGEVKALDHETAEESDDDDHTRELNVSMAPAAADTSAGDD